MKSIEKVRGMKEIADKTVAKSLNVVYDWEACETKPMPYPVGQA
jgi:hypothetical protein